MFFETFFVCQRHPSRILGYVPIDGKQEAAMQCSSKPIHWNTVKTKFIVQIKLGMDFNISFVTDPIDALVHPLCVIPDNSKEGCDTLYVVLLKKIGAVTLEKQYR